MTTSAFYRVAVWLPLLVPAAAAAVVHGLGVQPTTSVVNRIVQLLIASGVYGGIPYAVLAAYATWWINQKPEFQIRRRVLVAPLWMIAVWALYVLVLALRNGNSAMVPDLIRFGAMWIIPIGYAYVCLVLMARRLLRTHAESVEYEAAT